MIGGATENQLQDVYQELHYRITLCIRNDVGHVDFYGRPVLKQSN